jgi:hypothetical protein
MIRLCCATTSDDCTFLPMTSLRYCTAGQRMPDFSNVACFKCGFEAVDSMLHYTTYMLLYITVERTGMCSPQRWLASAVHSTLQQREKVAFLSPNEKYVEGRYEAVKQPWGPSRFRKSPTVPDSRSGSDNQRSFSLALLQPKTLNGAQASYMDSEWK